MVDVLQAVNFTSAKFFLKSPATVQANQIKHLGRHDKWVTNPVVAS